MQKIKTIDRFFYQKFGEQIRKRRQHLEMTQKELSKKIGVSRSLVDHWELGLTKVSDSKMELLCEALEMSNSMDITVKIGYWDND